MINTKPEDIGLSSTRLEYLTKSMSEYIEDGRVSGMNVLLARHGKVAYLESIGLLDIAKARPMQENAIFRIFSMTKPVVAVATMMLFEEGYFLLNHPIAEYIPEFRDVKVVIDEFAEETELVDLKRNITIKDLLMHTSGIGGAVPNSLVSQLMKANFCNHLTYCRMGRGTGGIGTLEEGMKKMATVPLFAQPGKAWRYSYGLDLLARLVEIVSGISFAEFIRSRVFEPLGMIDTGYFITSGKADRFSPYYSPTKDDGLVEENGERFVDYTKPPVFMSGSTGLVSTVSDYYRFSQMLLNCGRLGRVRLLSRKSVELIATNHLPDSLLPLEFPHKMYGLGYGFGVGVVTDASKCWYLASTGTYFWGGGGSTLFFIDPSEDLIAIVMPNSDCGGYPEFYFKFLTLVYQSVDD